MPVATTGADDLFPSDCFLIVRTISKKIPTQLTASGDSHPYASSTEDALSWSVLFGSQEREASAFAALLL